MKNILYFLFLLMVTVRAQSDLKVVRLAEYKEAWLAGDRQKALEMLLAEEKSGNLEIATLYNIGYLYFLHGEYNKALVYFQTVVVKDPSYSYSYLQIARIHRKIGSIFAARDHLEKGLAEDDENVDLLLELADVYQTLNETEKVEELYKEILDDDEDNVPAIAGLAALYRQQGRLDEARDLLEGNPSIYPEGSILLEKSRLYSDLGMNIESQQLLTQIILDYPRSQKWAYIKDTLKQVYNVSEIPVMSPLPTYTYKIDPEEVLDYKVSYGPIILGWLKVRIEKPELIDGKIIYPIIFYVDTNPTYDWILSLHHIYESYVDPITMNAVKTRLYTPGNDNYLARVYNYNYDENRFQSYVISGDGRFVYSEKDLPRKVQDSTSMLYFARGLVSDGLSGVTAVVIDEEYKYGYVTYLNEREIIESENKEINSIKIFARADFEGVAGMTGEAWGWFSPNDQAVPLRGAIEIFVGSITVEIDEEKTEIPNFHEETKK